MFTVIKGMDFGINRLWFWIWLKWLCRPQPEFRRTSISGSCLQRIRSEWRMVPENEHRLRERTKKSAPALTIIQSNHHTQFFNHLKPADSQLNRTSRHLPFTFMSILDEAIAWVDLTLVRSRSNQDFNGPKSRSWGFFPLRSRLTAPRSSWAPWVTRRFLKMNNVTTIFNGDWEIWYSTQFCTSFFILYYSKYFFAFSKIVALVKFFCYKIINEDSLFMITYTNLYQIEK